MSSSARATSSLQAYRLLVYQKALHPEFFVIQDRRLLRNCGYELECWISRGAHMMRFQHDGQCVVEVVTPSEDQLPDTGLLTTIPCAGEREHEERFGENVNYMTTVQTEVISDSLYRDTLAEMQDYARNLEAQWCRWRQPGCRQDNLSILDVQLWKKEVHAQAWHLDSSCGLVLRTQAIFELVDQPQDAKLEEKR